MADARSGACMKNDSDSMNESQAGGGWGSRILGRFGIRSRYYVRGGPYVIAANVLSTLVGAAFGIGLTHLCNGLYGEERGGETYGYFSAVREFYAIGLIFTLPMINHVLIRAVAQGREGAFRKVYRLRIATGLIGLALLVGLGIHFGLQGHGELALAFILSAFLFPVHAASDSWSCYYTGKQRLRETSLGQMAYTVVGPLALVTFLFSRSMTLFILTYLALQMILRVALMRRVLSRIPKDAATDPGATKYGIELSLINSLGIVQEHLHAVVLGFFLPNLTTLGHFHLARTISRQISGLWKAVCLMALPRLSQQTAAQSRRRMLKVLALFYPINIVGSIALVLLIPYPCRWLLPESFHDLIPYAQLFLIPACLVTPLDSLYRMYGISHAKRRKLLIIYAVDFLANLLSLPIFIHFYGVLGIIYSLIFAKGLLAVVIVGDLVRGVRMRSDEGDPM